MSEFMLVNQVAVELGVSWNRAALLLRQHGATLRQSGRAVRVARADGERVIALMRGNTFAAHLAQRTDRLDDALRTYMRTRSEFSVALVVLDRGALADAQEAESAGDLEKADYVRELVRQLQQAEYRLHDSGRWELVLPAGATGLSAPQQAEPVDA